MNRSDVIEDLAITAWSGPFSAETQARALAALEAGRVILCNSLPFEVAPDEAGFLNPAVGDDSRKNVSLDPATGKLGASALPPDDAVARCGAAAKGVRDKL